MIDYNKPEPAEDKIKRWTKIKNGYPEGHKQIQKIEEQIEMERKGKNANRL